jgi:molybdopterin/thiamine biosynthesis adenylyltransferase
VTVPQSSVDAEGAGIPIIITDPATDRYHTFGYISWWRQDIVRQARALVIGAGALGNEVLKNLALLGIGSVLIVDFDTIEDANLSRSVLFRSQHNGMSKAKVAAERVRELNPDVRTMALEADVNIDIGLGVFRRADIVIGCLDNRLARLAINRFCWHVNRPWVDGAIQEMLGEARVFWPNRGACYECSLKDVDYQLINQRYSCPLLARENILQGKVPTTPTIASIIAGIQTQDALKIINDMPVEAGKSLVFNGLINDSYLIEYPLKPDCLSHWVWSDIIELPEHRASTTTARELLEIARRELGPDAVLEFTDGMGRDIVTTLHCSACQTETEQLKPLYRVTETDAICPTCGETRQPLFTHTVRGDERFLDHTLSDLGIPPLHIIAARNGESYCFLELTGDAADFFQFT